MNAMRVCRVDMIIWNNTFYPVRGIYQMTYVILWTKVSFVVIMVAFKIEVTYSCSFFLLVFLLHLC